MLQIFTEDLNFLPSSLVVLKVLYFFTTIFVLKMVPSEKVHQSNAGKSHKKHEHQKLRAQSQILKIASEILSMSLILITMTRLFVSL